MHYIVDQNRKIVNINITWLNICEQNVTYMNVWEMYLQTRAETYLSDVVMLDRDLWAIMKDWFWEYIAFCRPMCLIYKLINHIMVMLISQKAKKLWKSFCIAVTWICRISVIGILKSDGNERFKELLRGSLMH